MDRDKIIKTFNDAKELVFTDDDEYTIGYNNGLEAGKNIALVLLKEQEAKQVKLYGKEEWVGFSCVCPDCKARWMSSESETHFCPNCGRPVKWK